MKAFISDLDNTMIFSYKKNIGENNIAVEKKGEKEISFMTSYSHNKLEILDRDYNFIPLTTRSLEQYRRINFFKNKKIKIVLLANGGILLENDKIVVDDSMATALPGVFAAGDCIGGILQVSTAVGEGAKAGISAIKFLREQKKKSLS